MRASSNSYSARVRPDRRLRQGVLGFGLVCTLLGSGCLLLLPAGIVAQAAAIMAWLLVSLRELVGLRRVYRGCSGYRVFDNGEIEVFGDTGARRFGRVLPGTVVMPGWAWLRLQTADGRTWGELVAGKTRESQQWRRFQVIFRHLNAC